MDSAGAGEGRDGAASTATRANMTLEQKQSVAEEMLGMLERQVKLLDLKVKQRSSALGEDHALLDLVHSQRRVSATASGGRRSVDARQLMQRTDLAYARRTRRAPRLKQDSADGARGVMASIYDGGVTIDKLLPPETLGKLERSGAASTKVAQSMELRMTDKKRKARRRARARARMRFASCDATTDGDANPAAAAGQATSRM